MADDREKERKLRQTFVGPTRGAAYQFPVPNAINQQQQAAAAGKTTTTTIAIKAKPTKPAQNYATRAINMQIFLALLN